MMLLSDLHNYFLLWQSKIFFGFGQVKRSFQNEIFFGFEQVKRSFQNKIFFGLCFGFVKAKNNCAGQAAKCGRLPVTPFHL